MKLENKNILITGASAGIGREFAVQMHARGANLCLVARREELLLQLKTELEEIRPNSVTIFGVDITASKSADFVLLNDFIKNNRIDILINNAGRGSFGYFDELELEHEISLVDLNITATLHIAHAVIPQMKKQKSGIIVSISSIAGFQPLPFMSTYCATKAFNLFHSIGLWYELKSFGIQVTVVCPGPVATEFGGVARVPGTVTGGKRDTVQNVVSWALKDIEKGRLISVPGLKAKRLVFLSSIVPRWLATLIVGRQLKHVLKLSKSS